MSRLVESGILTLLFFLVVNVVFLNLYFFSQHSRNTAASTTIAVATSTNTPTCDEACQKSISQKILATITPGIQSPAPSPTSTAIHEYVIPFGNGSTNSQNYEDIDGAEAYIDTALYPKIKQVIFETSMSIPTANGFSYVKLFNATDNHDVWFSEESMETNVVTLKDTTITLDPGKKLYRIMMKSTMGYEAKLYNAKIRIITE